MRSVSELRKLQAVLIKNIFHSPQIAASAALVSWCLGDKAEEIPDLMPELIPDMKLMIASFEGLYEIHIS